MGTRHGRGRPGVGGWADLFFPAPGKLSGWGRFWKERDSLAGRLSVCLPVLSRSVPWAGRRECVGKGVLSQPAPGPRPSPGAPHIPDICPGWVPLPCLLRPALDKFPPAPIPSQNLAPTPYSRLPRMACLASGPTRTPRPSRIRFAQRCCLAPHLLSVSGMVSLLLPPSGCQVLGSVCGPPHPGQQVSPPAVH